MAKHKVIILGANGMLGSAAVENTAWPYWWIVPKAHTQYVQRVASIPAPAPATLTEVCQVDVPAGFVFILRAIRQTFQTGTGGAPIFTDGSGSILCRSVTGNPP